MSQEARNKFGSFLIQQVRDHAIRDWDKIVAGEMKGSNAQRIHEALRVLDAPQIALFRAVIPQIVDTTLHHLLWSLEQEDVITVGVHTEQGYIPDLKKVSDGLPGELYTDEGWIRRFSKERYDEPEF